MGTALNVYNDGPITLPFEPCLWGVFRLDDRERPVAAGGVDNEAAKTDSAYRKGSLELHGWIGAGRLSRVGGAGTDDTSETLRQHSETGI